MFLSRLILFGLLASTELLYAQTDFRKGFIIENSGDTLYGEIDFRGDLLMGRTCKFKGADNSINEFSPNQIMAYRFIDSKYFEAREVGFKKVFLEYLIKGHLSIYYLRDNDGDHYYLDKEGMQLVEIPYESGIRVVDSEQVFYESKKHIGLLKYYMQDAPEFQSRIQSIKKPQHQNLVRLAEDYHNAVCEGEICLIYEKETPAIRILPEIAGGVVKYSGVEDLKDKFYFQTGLVGHIWLPRSSEKLYLRTGVLFSQLVFDTDKINHFKVPVQLEYIYPRGVFRPRVAYGLNFYKPRYQSVSLNFGSNMKLTEMFFLSVSSDIEFNPFMMLIPEDLLSYSLKLGIFMKWP